MGPPCCSCLCSLDRQTQKVAVLWLSLQPANVTGAEVSIPVPECPPWFPPGPGPAGPVSQVLPPDPRRADPAAAAEGGGAEQEGGAHPRTGELHRPAAGAHHGAVPHAAADPAGGGARPRDPAQSSSTQQSSAPATAADTPHPLLSPEGSSGFYSQFSRVICSFPAQASPSSAPGSCRVTGCQHPGEEQSLPHEAGASLGPRRCDQVPPLGTPPARALSDPWTSESWRPSPRDFICCCCSSAHALPPLSLRWCPLARGWCWTGG